MSHDESRGNHRHECHQPAQHADADGKLARNVIGLVLEYIGGQQFDYRKLRASANPGNCTMEPTMLAPITSSASSSCMW